VGPTAEYQDMRLSPDGRKLAVSMVDPQLRATDIWIIEVGRNVITRFTTEASDAGFALWSPDGSRIVFGKPHNAPPFLHQKPLAGGEEAVLLPSTGTMHWATDWSADGRFLLYADRNPTTNWDLWILPLEGDRQPVPFLRTRFRETHATFSPDGRWVAFVSDESGTAEVYVQPLRGPGERRRVSSAGGRLPRWRRDGREMFYLGLDNRLMAVPVTPGATFEPGAPAALFSLEPAPPMETEFDVTGDGQRFIVSEAVPETAGPPTVVLNWTAEIKPPAP
jgi:Tol biopolymer transport system component